MEKYLSSDFWGIVGQDVFDWLLQNIFVINVLIQLLIVVLGYFTALAISPKLVSMLKKKGAEHSSSLFISSCLNSLIKVIFPLLWGIIIWFSIVVADEYDWPKRILITASSLLLAWIIIKLVSTVIKNAFWAKAIAVIAWTIAALNIVDLLEPTINLLDSLSFSLGNIRLSVLGGLKAVVTLIFLLWGALLLTEFFERQIKASENFTPSIQVLMTKILKILLITIALLIALSSVGIDLTGFAVFSGAVGVGVGFGLQKIVSNLISGVILLLDKSIKPGDVIAVGDYYGAVDSLGARYVSVITRDGVEHLIPNEELITQRVENWSHSHNRIRLRIPVGVHYKADIHKAIDLCLMAAKETKRVLESPQPVCLLRGFGDSSVDLEIRFWINDPMNGRSNVMSDILLNVWNKFHEHDIEIPYPQRDLHLRSSNINLGPAVEE